MNLKQILGETEVEDYTEGESDMNFTVDEINIDGITPSTLSNSGLLIAEFVVDGDPVAVGMLYIKFILLLSNSDNSNVTLVNMVVNVKRDGDSIVREILSPLE